MNRFRYLNGIDWVITGLGQSLRQTVGVGNWSQLVFELEGVLDFDPFREAVQRYVATFPVFQGRAVRGWQLAPLWKIPRRVKPMEVSVEKYILPEKISHDALLERLGQCVRVPAGTPGRYVGFNLFYTENKTYLSFRFDHRLLDARGAERFISGLIGEGEVIESKNSSSEKETSLPFEPSNLRPWVEKFKSGRQVVRLLRRQQDAAAPFGIDSTGDNDPKFRWSLLSLTPAESEVLTNRAYDEAGYLMLTPWLAAKMSDALQRVVGQTSRSPLAGQVIPCAVDQRVGEKNTLFFNQVSFFYLCRPRDSSSETLPTLFSRQFFEQVQQGMPRHFEKAWKLARILPAALLGRLLNGPFHRFSGTFNLAHVGDGLSSSSCLAGLPVNNAFHLPIVPCSPGLGLYINTFQGRLNFCLTSVGVRLRSEEHDQLVKEFKRELFAFHS